MSYPTEGAFLLDMIYATSQAKIRWGDVPVTVETIVWEDNTYQVTVFHTFADEGNWTASSASMRAEIVVASDGTHEERVIYRTPTGGQHVKYRDEIKPTRLEER